MSRSPLTKGVAQITDPSLDLGVAFLRGLAADVVEASRAKPGQTVDRFGPSETGGTLIRPGGRTCYPAFWIRDFAMSLESGLIRRDELSHALFERALRVCMRRLERLLGT